MSELLPVILLAIAQGIAEFLPISSKGHLIVLIALFNDAGYALPDALGLTIVLHAGTLLSIIVVYGRRILALLTTDRQVIGPLIVATIPAGIAGLLIKSFFEDYLESPFLVGCILPITGLLLFWTAGREPGPVRYQEIGYRRALWIGLAQACAVLPGLSRSGTTIVAGLATGLNRESAATFSFLMAVPITAAACSLELIPLLRGEPSGIAPFVLLAGTVVAFVVGVIALLWLLRWLQQGRLYQFGIWCFLVSALVIGWRVWEWTHGGTLLGI